MKNKPLSGKKSHQIACEKTFDMFKKLARAGCDVPETLHAVLTVTLHAIIDMSPSKQSVAHIIGCALSDAAEKSDQNKPVDEGDK